VGVRVGVNVRGGVWVAARVWVGETVGVGVAVVVSVKVGVDVAVLVAVEVDMAVVVSVAVEVEDAVSDGAGGVSVTTAAGKPAGSASIVGSGTKAASVGCGCGSRPRWTASCSSPWRSTDGSPGPKAASLTATRETKVSPHTAGMRASPRRTVLHISPPEDGRALDRSLRLLTL
jgi:hypothetical protein